MQFSDELGRTVTNRPYHSHDFRQSARSKNTSPKLHKCNFNELWYGRFATVLKVCNRPQSLQPSSKFATVLKVCNRLLPILILILITSIFFNLKTNF